MKTPCEITAKRKEKIAGYLQHLNKTGHKISDKTPPPPPRSKHERTIPSKDRVYQDV
jgi:hypothetical protein